VVHPQAFKTSSMNKRGGRGYKQLPPTVKTIMRIKVKVK
jgi:hypothetical protein